MKLLKILVAPALALCVTLAPAADIDPPAVVGRLNYISGPVSFASAQANEDWSAAILNRPITTGDRLWTDSNGRAEMHVGSLAIRMGARTSLDVLALDEETLQLRLAQGTMNLRVRRLASDKLLEIATPSGAVVIRQPGSYRIGVDQSGAATMVTVRGGQAEVFTATSSFLVRDNQQATISGTRQDLFAAPPADEFDGWAAARDQGEDRIVSTRYVPDEMTGYEDLDRHGDWRMVPDYGAVWVPAAVPVGWAPYRNGRWVWVAPWGWTWVDHAPWGFAPFHYGRWVWLGNHWAWAPGRIVARPVYAPALVAFVGGANWSVSVGAGSAPAIGWVPLGWREPYRPWYRASHAHVRNLNVTHVTNITNNVTNIRHVNRNAPSAVTVVTRESFVGARPVEQTALSVNARTLAAAPVTQGTPVRAPTRPSLVASSQPGTQPPAAVRTRETIAVNAPPATAGEAGRGGREGRSARDGNDERRVRLINRERRVDLQAAQAGGASAPANPAPPAAETQRAQTQQADRRAPASGVPQPAFERDARTATPIPSAAEARREQRQAERVERQRERQAVQGNAPQVQAAPQPRVAPPALEAQRTQQARQREAQQQEVRQRAQQQAAQQQQEVRQRAQQQAARQQAAQQQEQQRQQLAREQQAREQPARQRELQRAQPSRQLGQEAQAAPALERRVPPQRAQQSNEKGSRERPRADRSDKG